MRRWLSIFFALALVIGAEAQSMYAPSVGATGATGATGPDGPLYLPASDFWSVASGDWVTAVAGTIAADSNSSGITVMQLSGSTANGFGIEFSTPASITSVTFSLTARAETAPAGTRTAPLAITCRQSVDESLESAWGTARSMGTWTFTTDEKWQTVETTITAANLGISANAVVQCEVARNPAASDDTMTEAMTIRGMKWMVQ